MTGESFRLETNGLEAAIERFPQKMSDELKAGIKTLLYSFEGRMKERMRSGPPWLSVRSGTLRRSIATKFLSNDNNITGTAFVTGKQALLQEFGGVNRPKSGKFLAIPLNRTPSGVSRDNSPLDYISVGDASNINNTNFSTRRGFQEDTHGLTRGFSQRTFVLPARRRPNLIVYLRRKRAAPVPLFVLVRNVKNPPRLGFFQTWKEMQGERDEVVRGLAAKAAELLTQ